MRWTRHIGVFGALLSLLALPAAAQVQMTASVDNTRPAVGATIAYTLSVESTQAIDELAVRLPAFDGFRAGPPAQTTSFRSVNGRISHGRAYSVDLTPLREGTIVIPAATATHAGAAYKSNAVTVTVGNPTVAGVSPALAEEGILQPQVRGNATLTEQLAGRIFVRPVVSKTNPFVREQVMVSYYLYISADVINHFTRYAYSPLENSHKSLLIESLFEALKQGLKTETEAVNGREFRRFLLSRALVTCTAPGRVELPDFSATAYLRGQQRRSPRGFFTDPFDDPFFDTFLRGNEIPVQLPTRPMTLDVRPLPTAGQPAGFNGAVGEYTISAALNKNVVKEYDLVELKVELKGQGAIASIPEPQLGQLDGIEVYESKGETRTDVTDQGFGGTKTSNIVLQPTLPGTRLIPPVSYSFFNPKTERYETIRTEPLTLEVAADPERNKSLVVVAAARPESGAASALAPGVRVVSTGIRTIKTAAPVMLFQVAPFYETPLFWVAQLLPLLVLGAAFAIGERRRRLTTDVAYARSTSARERASRRLKGAARALKSGDALAFHAEVGAALRGLVADRCALAAAGATNDELREAARARTGKDELGARLHALLEACDAARYAPGGAAGECGARWAEAKALTRELEKRLR